MHELKLGDGSPPLIVLLQCEAGYNLTGKTVVFKLQKPDASLVTRACTILNAATNKVQHDFIATDFDAIGRYKGEFVVTAGTLERTHPGKGYVHFNVTDDLPI